METLELVRRSVRMQAPAMARVDAFPKCGFREIWKITHPFVDRANTHQRVLGAANASLFPEGGRTLTFSDFYKAQRLLLFGHVLIVLLGGLAQAGTENDPKFPANMVARLLAGVDLNFRPAGRRQLKL